MSALDDFFAKKDRKKKGNKSGDGSKSKKNDQIVKKEKVSSITDNFKYISENNDEWLDFEENRDKDYSGLKIQSLSIKDKEKVLQEQKLAELNEESKGEGNAWSAKTVSQNQPNEDKKVEEEVQKEPEQPVVKKYIPPSLRSDISEVPKKVIKAPEIGNQSEFPTL